MEERGKWGIIVWWTLANVLGLLAGYWVGPQICDILFMSQFAISGTLTGAITAVALIRLFEHTIARSELTTRTIPKEA